MHHPAHIPLTLIAVTLASRTLILAIEWGGPLRALYGYPALLALCTLTSTAIILALRHTIRTLQRHPALATRPSGTARRAFVITIVGVSAYLIWGQPYSPLSADLALGSIASVCLLASASPRPRLPRPIELIAVNLCVLLVLAELGLRTIAIAAPSPIFASTSSSVVDRLELYRPAPGTLRWGFPCNSLGHYDSEFTPKPLRPPGQRIVAMVGDSFAAGIVPHAHHYSTVCERALRPADVDVDVYNFGLPAIGPAHYAHLLRFEILPIEPDVVLVHIFVGNDLFDFDRSTSGWSRTWMDRDRLLLVSVPRRLSIALDESNKRGTNAGSLQGETSDSGDYPWLLDYHAEEPSSSPERFLELERTRARALCTMTAASLHELLATIRAMRDDAGSTPMHVVLIPDVFQVDDPLWRDLAPTLPEDAERDRPQRLLTEALDSMGIESLDLLPPLRAEPLEPDGSRHLYHVADTHFNARGNAVVGRTIAEFVRPLLAR